MNNEKYAAISEAELARARHCMTAAYNNLNLNDYLTAANRAYYAAFHAMCSLLARDHIFRRHHSGIVSEFRRLYIRTGIFDPSYSDAINLLFDTRSESDYDVEADITAEEAGVAVVQADRFVNAVIEYLQIQ